MEDRVKQMLFLREQKWALQKIADKFDISRERVRQLIGNTGYVTNSPFYRKEELRQVQQYFSCSQMDVAELYYLTRHEIEYRQGKSVGFIRTLRKNNGFFKCYSCFRKLPRLSFYKGMKPLESIDGLRCKNCTKKNVSKYVIKRNRLKESTLIGKLRRRAYGKVNYAIKKGILTRPTQCEKYDKNCHGRIEANHWHGYDEEHALDVQWVCVYHHQELDKTGFRHIKH